MKKNVDVRRYLQQAPFFGRFDKEELSEISDLKSNFMIFKKGDLIIRQGDIDISFFVLIKGQVSVRKQEKPRMEIAVLDPGQIFGEMSYILESNRTSNVMAKSDKVTVLKLDTDTLESLSPAALNKIKDAFLKLLARRLVETDVQLSSLKQEVEGVIHANTQLARELSNIMGQILG